MIKVNIDWKHIKAGKQRSPLNCPISLGITEALSTGQLFDDETGKAIVFTDLSVPVGRDSFSIIDGNKVYTSHPTSLYYWFLREYDKSDELLSEKAKENLFNKERLLQAFGIKPFSFDLYFIEKPREYLAFSLGEILTYNIWINNLVIS